MLSSCVHFLSTDSVHARCDAVNGIERKHVLKTELSTNLRAQLPVSAPGCRFNRPLFPCITFSPYAHALLNYMLFQK